MKIHTDLTFIDQIQHPVITIGSFDGVHLGHREMLKQLVDEAKLVNGSSVVITFHPHPRHVLQPDTHSILLLHSPDEKARHLEKAGVDHLVVVPFTPAFANLTAEAYIEDFLIRQFHPHTLIVGHDHQFGKDRTGNYALLHRYAMAGSFKLMEIEPQLIESITISSTQIRKRLMTGDVASAHALLGYAYSFTGTVMAGRQIGRKLGFPTANLMLNDAQKLIPAGGVYAVRAYRNHIGYKAMMNIGTRPTFGEHSTSIEVHLLNFDEDLYGETLQIELVRRMRDEQSFPNVEALIEQLKKDRDEAGKQPDIN
jgi:riboflavin kinase/FMN adenylyltransferase